MVEAPAARVKALPVKVALGAVLGPDGLGTGAGTVSTFPARTAARPARPAAEVAAVRAATITILEVATVRAPTIAVVAAAILESATVIAATVLNPRATRTATVLLRHATALVGAGALPTRAALVLGLGDSLGLGLALTAFTAGALPAGAALPLGLGRGLRGLDLRTSRSSRAPRLSRTAGGRPTTAAAMVAVIVLRRGQRRGSAQQGQNQSGRNKVFHRMTPRGQ